MKPNLRLIKMIIVLSTLFFSIGILNCAAAATQVPRHLIIFFNTETKNELFTCGCAEKLGGLARRKVAIESAEYPSIILDVGGFSKASSQYEILKTETLLKAYNNMEYDAINVGATEYRLGFDTLKHLDEISEAPFISANIADRQGKLVFPPYHIVTRDGLKIGVLGVVSSAFVKDDPEKEYKILNIENQVQNYVPEVAKQCDLFILLANARDDEIERIAATNPDIDIILGGRTFNYSENDKPTRVAGTIIHKNGALGKYLGRLRLDLNPSTPVKIKDYEGFNQKLEIDMPEDEEILKILDDYRTILKTTDFTKVGEFDSEHPDDFDDMGEQVLVADAGSDSGIEGETPGYMTYTGALKCAECHKEIYNSWRLTRHANAFRTLQNEQQETNSQCLKCHTLGFNLIGGYVNQELTPDKIGVQCENCHGGGAPHVLAMKDESRKGPAITSRVPEFFCRRCHNEVWDPEFDMDKKLPLVDHRPDKNPSE